MVSRKSNKFFLIITLLLLIRTLYGAPTLSWETDYQQALAKGHVEKKPLLLYFTGSDWSGWGMKMKKEVLDSEAFQSAITPNFVCVEIDFPQYKLLSSEKIAQNRKLKEQFQVKEYPSLILLDSKQREIVRLGYLPASGEQLASDLLRIVQQDTKLQEGLLRLHELNPTQLCELYQFAQELQQSDAIDSVFEAGLKNNDPFFLLEKYRLLVEKGQITSVEGKSLRNQLLDSNAPHIHFTVATIEFQELAKKASKIKDLQEVVKPLEDYLAHFGEKDSGNVWRIEMMIAQFYLELDEWKTALQHAEIAYQSAPKAMQGTIEHSLNYIRDQSAAR